MTDDERQSLIRHFGRLEPVDLGDLLGAPDEVLARLDDTAFRIVFGGVPFGTLYHPLRWQQLASAVPERGFLLELFSAALRQGEAQQ